MINCKVETVTFDEISQMGIVLLQEISGDRILPVWVGIFEAQAILFRLQNQYFTRPLTHDLLKSSIVHLGGKIEYVYINKVEHSTFYAQIHIIQNSKKIVIDSRPSDAIAVALRAEVPIYVDEKVMDSNGIDREEFLKEQKERLYKIYLESLEDDELGKLKH
ncbi:MAG: bifunctional nuclease family protein [Elusimicrobiota bacterium]|nr:bifunctional nuclease family protein [Elusimicrobiota bacterium]